MLDEMMPRLTIKRENGKIETVQLDKEIISFGREPDNDVVVNHSLASRHHARIIRSELGYLFEDLNSTNGSYINGQRLEKPRMLKGEDEIWIADTVIAFQDPKATLRGIPAILQQQSSRSINPSPHNIPTDLDKGLVVNSSAKEVTINGELLTISLTANEFRLLEHLYEHAGEVCTKEQIAKSVWDYEIYDFNAVDALVYRLRQKLEGETKSKYIQTVRGFGYKLVNES